MSDWQVGDLAVCVDDRPNWCGPCGLTLGRVYRVVGIAAPMRSSAFGRETYIPGLLIAGVNNSPWGFAPERFRKIRPDEHEACETEFVTLLKRSKQRVSA